jgi:hypothetical protein
VKKISLSDKKRPPLGTLILAGWIAASALVPLEADGSGESRAGKPANSPAGAISRRRGYLIRPTPFFIPADGRRPGSTSVVAGRYGAVAAQGRALIALGGRGAILMRHVTSRNAARCQARGNEQSDYYLHQISGTGEDVPLLVLNYHGNAPRLLGDARRVPLE